MSDEPLIEAAADCGASTTAKSPCATENKADGGDTSSNRTERFASFGALLSAFIASSGCWLPPLLILGGVSGAGMTAIVEDYRPIFMVVTFGFLAFAFYLSYRPRVAQSSRGSRPRANIMTFNRVMLWAVTVIAVVFLFFPQVVTDLFASNDHFTADMDRTVISVEGMTGHTGASKAEKAIKSAPGVLAVKVEYEKKQATIGTQAGSAVNTDGIFAALDAIGYQGALTEDSSPRGRDHVSRENHNRCSRIGTGGGLCKTRILALLVSVPFANALGSAMGSRRVLVYLRLYGFTGLLIAISRHNAFAETIKPIRTFEKCGYVVFSPDGKSLVGKVSGKTWRATDLKLWEVATGKELRTIAEHTDRVSCLSFSPDATLLATGGLDGTVKLWDVRSLLSLN